MSSESSGAAANTASCHRTPRRAEDPADAVARVAVAKRSILLHLNRHRLRREDLEDCYSQAVLELVVHVRSGGTFADRAHLCNSLELRFNSRVRDRRRALSGRSPIQAAVEGAVALSEGDDGVVLIDPRADVERTVVVREEVRRVGSAVRELTSDQRLVLASQLGPRVLTSAEFCVEHGWSAEKFRKVSQRARARLARLVDRAPARVPVAAGASVEGPGIAYDHRRTEP